MSDDQDDLFEALNKINASMANMDYDLLRRAKELINEPIEEFDAPNKKTKYKDYLKENRDTIKKKSPSKYNDDVKEEDIRNAVNPLQGHPLLEKKNRKKEKELSKMKQYDNLEDLNNDREFKENLKIKDYNSDHENGDEEDE